MRLFAERTPNVVQAIRLTARVFFLTLVVYT